MHRHDWTARSSLLLLAVALLLIPGTAAIDPISPTDDAQIVNVQPLLSWTDHASTGQVTYTLTLSSTEDFSGPLLEHTTTTPYHQLQTPLTPGDWYWQVSATAPDGDDTSATNHFEIIDDPSYTIIPDLSGYDEDKRVAFRIDAPLGIALEAHITADGFDLPFTTDNLQKKTFTTFLDPGTYTLTATFTQQSLTTPYTTTFTVKEPPTPTHALRFNISDEEGTPLRGVSITLKGEQDYEGTTDDQGIYEADVEEGDYECTIEEQGYVEETFERVVDEDATLTIILEAEEAGTATGTVALAATTTSDQEAVTITSPTEKEQLTDDELSVTFTTTRPMERCDLLYKEAAQQGWAIKGTIDGPEEEATITAESVPAGDARIMVRCEEDDETYDSPSITITMPIQPEDLDSVATFLEDLDDAKRSAQGAQEPFLKHLNIEGRIAAARKQLLDMEEQYQELVTSGDEAAAEAMAEDIDERIRTLTSTLIIGSTIAEEEETVTTIDRQEARSLIKAHLATKGLDDDTKEEAEQLIEEEQQAYTVRTTIAVAELALLDGSKKYVTGLTRKIQRFEGEEAPATTPNIIESLPSSLLQVVGEPEVLNTQGERLLTLQEGAATFELPKDNTYTLLFTGNVKDSIDVLDAVAIIPGLDYDSLAAQDKGVIGSITGAATSAWESIGLDTASPWTLLIIVAIIATFIINPLTTIPNLQRKRRVRTLTEQVHDVLDLIEQERHDEAFLRYPSIITSFERLHPKHQEELSFAISNLSSELHAHTFKQDLDQASITLFNLSSHQGLPEIATITNKLISDYRELDPDAKEHVKPLLLLYQEQLRTKQRTLVTRKGPERTKRI